MNDTTNWHCPVDNSVCHSERECPHMEHGVRKCVSLCLENKIEQRRELWREMAKG